MYKTHISRPLYATIKHYSSNIHKSGKYGKIETSNTKTHHEIYEIILKIYEINYLWNEQKNQYDKKSLQTN